MIVEDEKELKFIGNLCNEFIEKINNTCGDKKAEAALMISAAMLASLMRTHKEDKEYIKVITEDFNNYFNLLKQMYDI